MGMFKLYYLERTFSTFAGMGTGPDDLFRHAQKLNIGWRLTMAAPTGGPSAAPIKRKARDQRIKLSFRDVFLFLAANPVNQKQHWEQILPDEQESQVHR